MKFSRQNKANVVQAANVPNQQTNQSHRQPQIMINNDGSQIQSQRGGPQDPSGDFGGPPPPPMGLLGSSGDLGIPPPPMNFFSMNNSMMAGGPPPPMGLLGSPSPANP